LTRKKQVKHRDMPKLNGSKAAKQRYNKEYYRRFIKKGGR
jgi:hypothetical protein